MRRLLLVVISCLAFAPAYAAFDALPPGIFGDEADTVRLQIVQGIAAAHPAEAVQHRVESKN